MFYECKRIATVCEKKIYNTLFRYKLMCIFAQTLKQKDNDLTTT